MFSAALLEAVLTVFAGVPGIVATLEQGRRGGLAHRAASRPRRLLPSEATTHDTGGRRGHDAGRRPASDVA